MISPRGSAAAGMKVNISPIHACLMTLIIVLIRLFNVEIPHPVHSVALAQYPPPTVAGPEPYPEPPPNTPIPPTNTPIPPTDTPLPPTNTATMLPTATPTNTPTNTPTATSTPPICDPERDLSGQITSKGVFEVINQSRFCDYMVGVATYRLPDSNQVIQEKNSVSYYDATTTTIKRAAQTNRPATLQLEVGYPSCETFAQHGFWGALLASLGNQSYGARELDQQQFVTTSCGSTDERTPETERPPDRERNTSPLLPERSIDGLSPLSLEALPDEQIPRENKPLDETVPKIAQPQSIVGTTPNTLPLTAETDERHGKGWLIFLGITLIMGGIAFRQWKIGYNAGHHA